MDLGLGLSLETAEIESEKINKTGKANGTVLMAMRRKRLLPMPRRFESRKAPLKPQTKVA